MSLDLKQLPQLATLFRHFMSGAYLNRLANAALWAELEAQQESYQQIFAALGFELRMDGRGFAWFHYDDIKSQVSAQSRQLALLFMVIFDTQADAGRALNRFDDWSIDQALLTQAFEQHQELLVAENLDVEGLQELLNKAANFGFAQPQNGHWQLLPAVWRYLDHFESLAQAQAEQTALLAGADDDRAAVALNQPDGNIRGSGVADNLADNTPETAPENSTKEPEENHVARRSDNASDATAETRHADTAGRAMPSTDAPDFDGEDAR